MITLLTYIGYFILALFLLGVFIALVIGFKFMVWFTYRPCKHCHHTMDYKGIQEEDGSEYYLFYCRHCNTWEEIPREEFILSCDRDCNPNEV